MQINEMLNNEWVHVRISSKLKEQVKNLAKKDKRKVSDYIRITLEKQVELNQ